MEQDLKIKNYLAYGVGDFISGGAQVVIGTLFLFFLIEVVGLRAIWAGVAILVGRGWDAVTDPLIGYISDNTKSRFERRRIFFLIGFIPMLRCALCRNNLVNLIRPQLISRVRFV